MKILVLSNMSLKHSISVFVCLFLEPGKHRVQRARDEAVVISDYFSELCFFFIVVWKP